MSRRPLEVSSWWMGKDPSCFILKHIQRPLQVAKAIQLSRNCKCVCTANICLHSKARNTADQHFWQVSNSKPVIWLSKSRRAWKMLGYLISKYILANASSWDHLSIETVILLACLILQELPSSSGFQLSFLESGAQYEETLHQVWQI